MEMEMLLINERRSVRRAADIECRAVRGPGGEALLGRTLDVSEAGMRLSSKASCAVGDHLDLCFSVPGIEREFQLSGRVARIEKGNSEECFEVGIDFDALDTETRRLLRSGLSALPEQVSSHPPRVDYAATAGLISLLDFGY